MVDFHAEGAQDGIRLWIAMPSGDGVEPLPVRRHQPDQAPVLNLAGEPECNRVEYHWQIESGGGESGSRGREDAEPSMLLLNIGKPSLECCEVVRLVGVAHATRLASSMDYD